MPNHVKYCVSVCLASFEQLSVYHQSAHGEPESPTIGIRAYGLSGVWFCSKIKVVKIVFWPYHFIKEEETKPLVKTASKSDVGNVHTRRHAPAGLQATRTDARHASSSPRWADPTRIPVDPIHVPDPDKDDVSMTQLWRHHAQSACRMTSAWCNYDVIMHSWHVMSAPSQLTRQQSGTHLSRHQPRAEPIWAEPSWSQATSREVGSSVADPMCNQIWDWIWVIH